MRENQLIFLISQPRSGSTLTQKILGAHSKIYTRSEPWLMLYPSYSLKNRGVYSEYNFIAGRKALDGFIDGLPEGKKTYLHSLGEMYLDLYSSYIDSNNYSYFLDKTPRYYLIINELMDIYPKAKYILLIRNPLAVLGSIINTWIDENWYRLSEYKSDLTRAIDEQLDVINNKKKSELFLIVHYEELLANNEKSLEDIFDFLSLEYETGLEGYNQKNSEWEFGDQESVLKSGEINKDNDKKWQLGLKKPQYWRMMHDYLHYIGKEKFEKLGYSFEGNLNILKSNMPADTLEDIESKTFPLFSFLDDTRECLLDNQKNKSRNIVLNREVKSKNKLILSKDKRIEELHAKLNDVMRKYNDVVGQLDATADELNMIWSSRAYRFVVRLTNPLSFVKRKVVGCDGVRRLDTSGYRINNNIKKYEDVPCVEEGGFYQNAENGIDVNSSSFSVITVVYNDAQLLEKTIKSVINQSYQNIEYIIIDGGSTDGTLEIIKKYENNITHWVSEEDEGIYNAMNKGIELSNGDWLNFMNAGDVFADSETLDKVTQHTANDIDVVYGDRYYLKKGRKALQKAKDINVIFQRMPFGHQSTFVRKEVIKKYKFNDTYKFAADYDLLLNLYLSGHRFEYIGFPVCEFLSGGESESGIRPYLEAIKILLDNTNDPVVIKNNDYVQAFRKQARSLIDDCLVTR